jgi:hypothetical protein
MLPSTTDSTPQMLVPAIQTPAQDRRGRFREIFCAVIEARKDSIPDYRSCDDALKRVGQEAPGTGMAVSLGQAQRKLKLVFVPGLGRDCFSEWLAIKDTIPRHVREYGYDMVTLDINGLSSCELNARQISDAILSMPQNGAQPDLVLVGFSKGAIDVLTAVVNHPEIHSRVAAVVSLAGSIGGSPLANMASEGQLNLLQYFPGATCKPAGGGALHDLRPDTRQAWLAEHTLPEGIAYYSLITYPDPDRISGVLRNSYHKLSRVDARNDSQLIFYDQFIPDSTLVAYLNADHWAVALALARTHAVVGELLVEQNEYPREALFEALLRFIEEDLGTVGD